jgi:hypothetical protein
VRFKNIFVLSPGRSGSKTFVEAASYLTNYSAAHESLSSRLGDERFAYPENHIEADNRLTWFTGELAKRFTSDVLYINLIRDFDATVDSFHHRLQNSSYRASIMTAFGHGIVMKPGDWRKDQERELAAFYVQTVQSNIEHFLKDREHRVVHLEDGGASFDEFLQFIGAEGDLAKVRSTWLEVHNARR